MRRLEYFHIYIFFKIAHLHFNITGKTGLKLRIIHNKRIMHVFCNVTAFKLEKNLWCGEMIIKGVNFYERSTYGNLKCHYSTFSRCKPRTDNFLHLHLPRRNQVPVPPPPAWLKPLLNSTIIARRIITGECVLIIIYKHCFMSMTPGCSQVHGLVRYHILRAAPRLLPGPSCDTYILRNTQ